MIRRAPRRRLPNAVLVEARDLIEATLATEDADTRYAYVTRARLLLVRLCRELQNEQIDKDVKQRFEASLAKRFQARGKLN